MATTLVAARGEETVGVTFTVPFVVNARYKPPSTAMATMLVKPATGVAFLRYQVMTLPSGRKPKLLPCSPPQDMAIRFVTEAVTFVGGLLGQVVTVPLPFRARQSMGLSRPPEMAMM